MKILASLLSSLIMCAFTPATNAAGTTPVHPALQDNTSTLFKQATSLLAAGHPSQAAVLYLRAGDMAVKAQQLDIAAAAYQKAADAFHLANEPGNEATAYERQADVYIAQAGVTLPTTAVPATPAPTLATSKPPTVTVLATQVGKAGLTIRVPGQVASGTPFTVQVYGFAGDAGDWVTVASVGEADTTYHEYFYADSKREAEFTFVRPLDPGDYEVRVFFDQPGQKNVVQARQRFTVTGTAKAKGPVPANLPKGTYQCFLYAPHLNGSGGFSMSYEVQADITLGSASYPFTYDTGAGKMRFTGGPFKDIVADTFFHAGGPAIGFNRRDGVLENCWPR